MKEEDAILKINPAFFGRDLVRKLVFGRGEKSQARPKAMVRALLDTTGAAGHFCSAAADLASVFAGLNGFPTENSVIDEINMKSFPNSSLRRAPTCHCKGPQPCHCEDDEQSNETIRPMQRSEGANA